MKRIFLILMALVSLLVLASGGGVYFMSAKSILEAKHQANLASAEGAAMTLGREVELLHQVSDVLAQSPEVVNAFARNDLQQLAFVAKQLERYLPGVMKIRLISASGNYEDSDEPVFGFADQELVKESMITMQAPAIHDQGKNQHLAIASRAQKNNMTLGVMLASIKPDVLYKSIQPLTLESGYLRVMQGQLVLFEKGDPSLKGQEGNKVSVPNTRWEIQFWDVNKLDSAYVWLICLVLASAVLLSVIGIYILYKYFEKLFLNDSSVILKAAKDLLAGKAHGNYPVSFVEIQNLISTLVQFQRVVDSNIIEKPAGSLKSFDRINDFLEESEGFDYLADFSGGNATKSSSGESKKINPVKKNEAIKPKVQTESIPSVINSVANPSSRSLLYGPASILGITDKSLTKEVIYDIGRAYGSEAVAQGIEQITLGYDGRVSSQAIAESLAKGIISTGINVTDIGLVPIPVLNFVIQHMESRSGVMVSGSPNPSQFNGLFLSLNGIPVHGEGLQRIKKRIEFEDFQQSDQGNIERNQRYIDEYIGVLAECIHIVRPMKVVLDCSNGAASVLGPKVLRTLGCEVIELFCEIDGNFNNHGPNIAHSVNLNDLVAAVQHYQADVGIALDDDGDSIGVVDSRGNIIMADRLLMLFAKDVLEGRSGATVIHDFACSKIVSAFVKKMGAHSCGAHSGFPNMLAKIKEHGAKLAGEMRGQFYFLDNWLPFPDGIYAAARLVQVLSDDPRNSAEYFNSLPVPAATPEYVIELAEGENQLLCKAFRKNHGLSGAKISDEEGVLADFGTAWGMIRADDYSNSLLIRFEAGTSSELAVIQEQFRDSLLKIKPDLNLPF